MKKTLKSGFARWPPQNLQLVHNISSILVRIKLHTTNQPPSLLNSGDSYEEVLQWGFGRWPQRNFQIFLSVSSSLDRIKLLTKNQLLSLLNSGDDYEEDLKIWIWKTT